MLLLLIFSLVVKMLFWQANPNIIVQSDTYGYYETGQRLYKNRLINDTARTPAYPLFITLPAFINGRIDTPLFSGDFVRDMRLVILTQAIIATLSLMFLYKMLQLLKIKKLYAFLFFLFMSLNINYFASDLMLLTESLTGSLLILTVYLTLRLLRKFTNLNFIFLWLFLILGFFIKPVYILLPVLIMAVLILVHGKKMLIPSFILLSLFALIVSSYINLNGKYYGFRGVSRIANYNLLGVILKRNISIESARYSQFYPKIKEYRRLGYELMPFRFMEYMKPGYFNDKKLLDEMDNFNKKVIKSNLPDYFIKSLAAIPSGQMEKNESIFLPPKYSPLFGLFDLLQNAYTIFQITTLIVIPGFIFVLVRFLKKRELNSSMWLAVGTVSVYQIVLSVFLSYGEFGRLISPALPFIFLFSFYCWYHLIKFLRVNYQ